MDERINPLCKRTWSLSQLPPQLQPPSFPSFCKEVGTPFHYSSSCYLTASNNFYKPSENPASIWWRNILSNKLSRLKSINSVSFLIENENLIKPRYEQNNTSGVGSSSDSETFSPSTRPQTSMIQRE
ncbi:hypothetical protein AVEN_30192-1 [Araneus ventricosus]|uniref:Uncharacterized protein n=1 Tax=Araneus ventricosus TaxID=182803 RepID=A0A4Y2DRZ3_ARAVE|nr:hypothetical protein AVEN_30192-1 [Araneus ventricosus]